MPIGAIWQTVLETPLINFMMALTALTFGSFGLAILLFTVITRAITFPLTLRTLRSTRAMQEIQPRIQEIQKKYSDPKRRTEETMKLYREAGVNPLGCLGPQLIQMPIFIAMYQVVRITLSTSPEGVLYLEGRLYDVDLIRDQAPLATDFLFLDLAAQGNILLAAVVFAAMWLQQRISAARNASIRQQNDQQAQMNQMLQWLLPGMFSWFVLIVPTGLGLYWAASTIIGLVLQWIFVGPGDFTWGSLVPGFLGGSGQPVPARAAAGASGGSSGGRRGDDPDDDGDDDNDSDTSADDAGDTDASSGSERSNRRRSRRTRSRSAGARSRSGRRRRHS